MTGSAGFDSGCGASGSVGGLFVSSGRGTGMATGVLWDELDGGMEAGNSADTVSGGAISSEGVRNTSFEGSASPGDESRRLQSVGASSGFAVTGS